MSEKICPLISGVVATNGAHIADENKLVSEEVFVSCGKEKCALWVAVPTTEGLTVHGCAFGMMTLKNSEGQYRV